MDWTVLTTQIVAGLGVLSGLLLALRKFILTTKAGKLDQKAELDAAIKLSTDVRSELRQDNEKLRTRVAILEAHVETLDKEISALQEENKNLEEAKENLLAEIRILKLALSKTGATLKLDNT